MIHRIAIIGLGLMGASLALDLSTWQRGTTIIGYDRDRETMEWCSREGVIDQITQSPEEAVKGADLVFIAVPVRSIPHIFSTIKSTLIPQACVFDLGSTRRWIFDHLPPPPPRNLYCGFHPMGGGVDCGAHYARKQLFKGKPVLVTPYRAIEDQETDLIHEIADCLGSKVFF